MTLLAAALVRRSRETTLILSTGAQGAAYARAGEAIAETLSETMVRTRVFAAESSGGRENVERLERGDAHLALTHSSADLPSSIRALARLYEEPLQIVARGTDRIEMLCDKRLAIGAHESNTNSVARLVVAHFCTPGSKPSFVEVSYEEGRRRFERGDVDAFFIMTGLTAAIVAELVAQPGTELVSLGDPSKLGSAIEGFRVRHPEFSAAVIPERAYGGQPSNAVGTVAASALLVARADLSEALAADVTRALFEHRSQLARREPVLARISADLEALTLPLHSGARDYYHRNEPSPVWRWLVEIISLVGAVASAFSARDFLRRDRMQVYYRRVRDLRDRYSGGTPEILVERHDALRRVLRDAFDDLAAGELAANESFLLFLEYIRAELSEARNEVRAVTGERARARRSVAPAPSGQ